MPISSALTSRILDVISLTSGVLERVRPNTRDAVGAAAGDGNRPVKRSRRTVATSQTPNRDAVFQQANDILWLASWGARLRIQNRDIKGRKAAPISRGFALAA